tara:strand:+ start:127280 stop:127828 length:549 start_codon:yes stop_codon:yes gene_type:complete
MNRSILLLFLTFGVSITNAKAQQHIERLGQVTFFSYTSVENIQAVNNKVLSIIDLESGKIEVSVLMRAFVFKKSLMKEHFNESYIESDLYPRARLFGQITDFDSSIMGSQTRIIKGNFTLRNITKPIEIKAEITKSEKGYTIKGELEVKINDYEINVPPILSPNIAKKIQISFNFQYKPYEN